MAQYNYDYNEDYETEEESTAQDDHFSIYLIIVFICFPISLFLLKCFVIPNVPWKDLFFLQSAVGFWTILIWYIILFGTETYCTVTASEYCFMGGLKDSTNAMCLILITIFTILATIVFEPLYAYSWGCGCSENPPLLPVDLNPTPVETFREIIRRIETTGPTLTAGVVREKSVLRGQRGQKTSFWALVDWEQFPYHSWSMNQSPYPYFHEEQDGYFGFKDLEEVFSYDKPLVIKTYLDVSPDNDQTKMKYESWVAATTTRIRASVGTSQTLEYFVEEMVTDEELFEDHTPNHLIPSIQLPSLVTKRSENFVYSHIMVARDTMICNKTPFWMSHTIYNVFGLFFLSSLYRVLYWSLIRVVKLNFKKSFNTETDQLLQQVPAFPYKNHLENFVIKPMA